MKVLVLVYERGDIPHEIVATHPILVASPSTWRELPAFLDGKTDTLYLYVSETMDTELLLKVVEDYVGDMVCYCAAPYNSTFASRFSRTVSRLAERFDLSAFKSALAPIKGSPAYWYAEICKLGGGR